MIILHEQKEEPKQQEKISLEGMRKQLCQLAQKLNHSKKGGEKREETNKPIAAHKGSDPKRNKKYLNEILGLLKGIKNDGCLLVYIFNIDNGVSADYDILSGKSFNDILYRGNYKNIDVSEHDKVLLSEIALDIITENRRMDFLAIGIIGKRTDLHCEPSKSFPVA